MKSLLRDIAPKMEGDRSQFGEGSIISEILRRLGIVEGVAVEFGAGDGVELSNTRHLWDSPAKPWAGVLIEADPARYCALADNTRGFPVAHFEAVVTPDNVNSYVPYVGTQVVSIDVDGADFDILCAMDARPAALCVEHHPMIPAHVSMIGGQDIGCSALALKEWADENDYRVVALTHCNTIMVPSSYLPFFDDIDLDFLHMFDPSGVTWVLSNVKTGDYGIHGPWPFGRGEETTRG